MNSLEKNKAIFLDRDGVIFKEVDHLYNIKDAVFLPNVFLALQNKPDDFCLIIITNQAGIAKKMYTIDDYKKINQWMIEKFIENNIKINRVYYCSHHPADKCQCRKPAIGLLKQAQNDFNLDLQQSWFVGDKTSDILAGQKAGCQTILIKTGYAGRDKQYRVTADYLADDLLNAVEIIKKKNS